MNATLPSRPAAIPVPGAAVILGSGLGDFVSYLKNATEIPYHNITGFPEVTVEGHTGSLFIGTIGEKTVMVFSGRFHHYEGHPLERTVLPVQLAQAWGAKKLVVSNAAGGLHPDFEPGDLMLITGWISPLAPRYAALPKTGRSVYVPDPLIRETARKQGVHLAQGTYCFLTGPSYETPAEIRALRFLGADAVGMSTVPELVEASRLGLPSVAISLITNKAAGLGHDKLDHAEVKDIAARAKARFGSLVSGYIEQSE
jgi:purine-nucleoside phosphorylase